MSVSPVDPQSHAAALGVASFALHLKFPGLVPTPTMEFRSTEWRDLGAVEWSVMQRNRTFPYKLRTSNIDQ